MPAADTPANDSQGLNLSRYQNPSDELQEVLSTRLPSFQRCALRVLGNVAEAEDAVQEALLAAHRHVNQFRGRSQMSTWLTTIVRNCALMQLRKRPRQLHLSLDEQMEQREPYLVWERLADRRPNPEDEFVNSELNARLRRLTARLSPTLRRTFELRVFHGLSTSETARRLRLPQATVKARLARARARVARYMEPGLVARSVRST
jgi:RNA polymerase sigma-70 factor, ECF subfamily